MNGLPGENYQKISLFFSSYSSMHFSSNCPLQIWTSNICIKDISKTITASSLRFGQLIEVGE